MRFRILLHSLAAIDMTAYQAAFRKLVSRVDGVDRQATPWPDWEITSVIDNTNFWPTVWRHLLPPPTQYQIVAYEALKSMSPEDHEALWGHQTFYRVFSLGQTADATRETDLLEESDRNASIKQGVPMERARRHAPSMDSLFDTCVTIGFLPGDSVSRVRPPLTRLKTR